VLLNHLDTIATKHGTDKSMTGTRKLSAKAYTVAYNNYLEPIRDEPIVMLEIGVWQGSSLRMWEEFLPNARLFAIDIDPSCKRHETARSKVFIGDQTDSGFLKQVAEAVGEPFHCIIDDGGHQMEHHQASLPALWPYLKDGGWYAIEDLHTCYLPHFGGGYKAPESTVESVLKPILDTMNYEGAPPSFVPNIGSMHVYPSVTFLFKGLPRSVAKRSAWSFLRR
jgi:cephalosporin hydroxylase